MFLGFWYKWKYEQYRKQFTSKNLMKRFNKIMKTFPKKLYEVEQMKLEIKWLQQTIDEKIIEELAQQKQESVK